MWWFIALWIISAVAVYFLMPKPETAKPPEVQEVDIASVEDGKTIPVLFGTRNTESFNVVWWGDVVTRSWEDDLVIGYYYFVGVHAVLFHGPIDNISQIISDDKLAWAGENTGGELCIPKTSADLYGGKEQGGGFGGMAYGGEGLGDFDGSGCVDIDMGYPDQVRNWYLEHNLDGGDAVGDTGAHEIPAFRGVTAAILKRIYIGTSPNLRKLSFRGQRIHVRQDGIAQWYDAKSAIPGTCSDREIRDVNKYAIVIAEGYGRTLTFTPDVRTLQETAISAFIQYLQNQGTDHFDQYNPDIARVAYNTRRNQTVYTPTVCPFDPGVSRVGYTTNSVRDITGIDDFEPIRSVSIDAGNGLEWDVVMTAANEFFAPLDDTVPKMLFIVTTGMTNPWGCWWDGGPINGWIPDASVALSFASAARANRPMGLPITGYRVGSWAGADEYIDLVVDEPTEKYGTWQELTQALIDQYEANMTVAYSLDYNDLNPAHLIRECLTDPDWGMGGDENSPDETSFISSADTLYDESMGISIKWTTQTKIDDFIDLIKKHINAELYPDHSTGKQILKLIRDDYDVADLITLGENDIVKVDNVKRPLIGELINSVTVQYWDSCINKDASVVVVDQALVQMQGATINTTIQYPGFTNKRIATLAAARDLRVLSAQLLSCTIYVKRTAENLNLGSVFVLHWPDLEISGIVMRVQGIDFGTGRQNTIKLDVVEDVFGLSATVVVSDNENDPSWTNPSQDPVDVDYQIGAETPYYNLVQSLGQPTTDSILSTDSGAGYASMGAVRPGNAINGIMAIDSGGGYVDEGVINFCGTLTLDAAVDQIEKIWSYDVAIDIVLFVVGDFAQIDDELVRIDAIDATAGTITVGRAVLDTSPRVHAIGARLYGWGSNSRRGAMQYTDSDSINIKVKTVTGAGILDIADATAETVVMGSRAIKPYPPGDLQIDGTTYPIADITSDSFEATWAHRDRLTQGITPHTDGDTGPEAGTTYTIYVIDSSDVTQVTYSAISGTSQTVDMSAEPDGDYTLQLWAVRSSIDSWQCAEWEFTVSSIPVFSGTIADMESNVDSAFSLDVSSHWSTGGTPTGYSLQNAPTWMNIDSFGEITGTPTTEATTTGITITGTNSTGNAVSNAFEMIVSASLERSPNVTFDTDINGFGNYDLARGDVSWDAANQAMKVDCDAGTGDVYVTVNCTEDLIVGRDYTLSFDYSYVSGSVSLSLAVYEWDDGALGSIKDSGSSNTVFTFTADYAYTGIMFRYSGSGVYLLDNVSIMLNPL